MTREERENHISDLCDQHGCKDKIRRIHFELYVDKNWHPHPPQTFTEWFKTDYPQESEWAVAAYNTKYFFELWHEAKQFGVT